MYFKLKGYNCGTYTDYKDAKANGDVHSTPSTIDSLTIDGSSLSGLFDLQEVVTLFADVSGLYDVVFGIEKDDKFYPLKNIIANASKLESSMDADMDTLLADAEEK
ncbi:hypothetical protein REH81_00440 [Vibrio rotiferianus]